jgi:stage V sporulation protein D (sporulation-specific penicillin-binding protein)
LSRYKFSKITVKKRLLLLFVCIFLLVTALILRLAWLQLVRGPELQAKAWEQWTRSNPARAQRGDILDRHGRLLAGSASSLSIMARPNQIKEEDKAEVAKKLAPILEMQEERLLELLQKKADSVYLKRQMPEEVAQEIRKLNIRGIHFSPEPKRYYPHGSLASQLLGFVGLDEGLAGLENQYETELKGQDGRIEMQTDGRGHQLPQGIEKFIPPVDGYTLELTIDQNIQFIMEREMERVMLESQPKGIMAIAVDPQTGEVLGIAGKPDFDPNNYADYPQVNWKLTPVTNTFEPGSTFKLVTLAAAIEEGKFNAAEGFYCSGYTKVAGTSIGCWTRGRGGHGAIDFTKVVLGSCNPGFIELQERIGAVTLMNYVKAFGFGQKTGIDIIGEGTGILFSPQQYGPVEAATTSFGQGVSVTPIQQVMAVSAMINGGYLLKPYIVKEIRDSEGTVLTKKEPQVVRRVISSATSEEVKRIMELVVTEGSGINGYIEGYRIGGKTGTAQKVGPNGRYISGEYILSYIGFVPMEDPQIILYIAVDAPQVGPQWGSQVCAPMFRRMMESILNYLNIPPSTTPEEAVPSMVEVPNLIGLPLDDHTNALLENNGLLVRFIGEGPTVLNQTPKAGAKVPLHTQVLVYLGGTDEEEITVPDLSGKTMREVGEVLGWLGLRLNSSGSGVAVQQEPKAYTKVAPNSVISVEFAAPDAEQR